MSATSASTVVNNAKRVVTAQKTPTSPAEVTAIVNKMDVNAVCEGIYSGYIKFNVLADRLLKLCGTGPKANATYAKYLRTLFPDFTVRGPETAKGERLYPAQRAYNNLAYHYRSDKGKRDGTGRTFESILTGFFTSAHKLQASEWVPLFIADLEDEDEAVFIDHFNKIAARAAKQAAKAPAARKAARKAAPARKAPTAPAAPAAQIGTASAPAIMADGVQPEASA